MKLLLLTLALIALLLLIAVKSGKDLNRHMLLIVTAVTSITAVVVYRKFLFGEATYLYSVADACVQYYPNYINLARILSEGQGLPLWTMSVGFGSVQSYEQLLYPLYLIPICVGSVFGSRALLLAFAWTHIVKIVLAAVFAYLFLRRLRFSAPACGIMSVAYAFSGILIVRGYWGFPADECFIAMFLLWSVECYFQDKDWRWIPLAVYLIAACFGIYYLYLYALLLFIYATVRFIHAGRAGKQYFPFLLRCGGLYALGILMWSVILFGFSWAMFSTARYDSTVGHMGLKELFKLTDPAVLLTALLSTFSINLTGRFDLYQGALNYLERPIFYCGLGTLLLIPQAWVRSSKKKRRLLIVGAAFVLLYLLFPAFVDFLNAFIRNEELGQRSYRMSSLWILIIMVVMATDGLEYILSRGVHTRALLITGSALLLLLLCCCHVAQSHEIQIDRQALCVALAVLIGWCLLSLSLKHSEKRLALGSLALAILMLGDVSVTAMMTVNRSVTVAKEKEWIIRQDSMGYYGDLMTAVNEIKAEDGDLYRIACVRANDEYKFCAPLYFGTFDSSYYTSIDANTYRFTKELYPEAFINDIGMKYSVGVGEDLPLSALTGYKYIIAPSESAYTAPDGYQLLKNVGSMRIYKNTSPLPFGLAYDTYVSESAFSRFSDAEQRMLLLQCAVLPDDAKTDVRQLSEDEIRVAAAENDLRELIDVRGATAMDIASWKPDHITGSIQSDQPAVLVFSISNIPGWQVRIDGENAAVTTADLGFIGVGLTPGAHTVELVYHPPLLLFGILASALAWILYLVLFVRKTRQIRRAS